MPKIFYSARNYQTPYQYINTTTEEYLYCRKLDLYRTIITVGSPSFISWKEIKRNGFFRTISNSIFSKILLVSTNIQSTPNGIGLHPIFDNHVSDQKRIVSYNLGMAFAKYYSEKLLYIPNLTHLETLKKIGAVEFVNSDRRTKEPDLAGMSKNQLWHIVEAKGMSSNKLSTEVKIAKEQGLQVRSIYGKSPETTSACATYFGQNRITSLIEDPVPIGEKEIKINDRLFFEGYYNNFLALEEYFDKKPEKGKFKGVDYKYFNLTLEDLNLQVGLESEIYEMVKNKRFELIPEFYANRRDLDSINSGLNTEEISIGLDGFVLKYANY